MKITTQIFSVALLGLVLVACKNTDYKKTKEGYPYKVFSDGKGEKIMPGYVVRYHQTVKMNDSVLGTTYGQQAQWMPIPKEGLDDNPVFKFMMEARKGDSILWIRPVDSLIAKNPQAGQDSFLLANKGKELRTIIKVVEVYKDEAAARSVFEQEKKDDFMKNPAITQQKAKDDAAIDAYLKANNIATTRSPWGTYVQVLTPGSGPKPKAGDFVMLRYTGKFLGGEEFDSNNKPGAPLLPLQVGAGGAITGFEDGVKQLSKGAKANIYIPSVLGYGAQGYPPKIAPNQNLMFEIEVVDISDKQPAPPTMPPADTTRK